MILLALNLGKVKKKNKIWGKVHVNLCWKQDQ